MNNAKLGIKYVVDDAFFKGGVNKSGDKRGRGTNKVPVIVRAAVKDEAFMGLLEMSSISIPKLKIAST